METESPVLFRILGGNTLPNWSDIFLRNIDLASAKSLRDTQEDAFQGHRHSFNNNIYVHEYISQANFAHVHNSYLAPSFYEHLISLLKTDNPTSDDINGTPRVANETRPKNFAAMYQIVRAQGILVC